MSSASRITFQSYPRIRESFAELSPEQAKQLHQVSWIATEKIHGANFCILSDGSHVECAKRKGVLDASEDFFGYRDVVAPLFSTILSLYSDVLSWSQAHLHAPILQIALHGELYGGGYAHPRVVPVPGIQRVQTGVDYAPHIHLCGFDLSVVCDSSSPPHFLDFDVARALAASHALPWVEALARAPLGELLGFDTDFDSTLPARHNLPALPARTNLVEGVVLRPERELHWPPGQRPLIKLKSPRFAEDERYHQAVNWSASRAHLAPGAHAFERLEWAATARLTPPRYQAAMSKLGRPKQDGDGALRAAIAEEVLHDIFGELQIACAQDMLAVSHQEIALLRDSLREDVLEMGRGLLGG